MTFIYLLFKPFLEYGTVEVASSHQPTSTAGMSRRGGGEEDWIWDSASKRGGAGAPLKQGANLRLAVHNQNSGARPYDDDEEEEQYNSHAHVRDNGRDSNSSTKNYSSTNASTPTKFMSSLRDMHR